MNKAKEIKRDKKNNKEWISYIVLFGIILLLGITCLGSSPLWKWSLNNDSCVFQIMGKGLLTNKVIYKDLFDHKGPIMYLINAIGIFINPQYGLFIIETVLLYIGTTFIYKSAKCFLNKKMSLLVSVLYILFMFIPISEGNCTEEYACVFSAIGLYYIIKVLFNEQINSKTNWLMIGITFALNLFIKPTYIALWIAFAITILLKMIRDKQFKELFKGVLFAIAGVIVITAPIAFYMVINNCLLDFWNAFIIMNMKYSNSTIMDKIISFVKLSIQANYIFIWVITILGNILIVVKKQLKKDIILFVNLNFIITILFTAIAPFQYMHYLTQCATMLAINYAFVFYSLKQLKNGNLHIITYCLIVLNIIIIIIAYNYSNENTIFNEENNQEAEKLNYTLNYISGIMKEDDECLSIGNHPYIYIYLNKDPQFKYFFQYPIGIADKTIAKETLEYIKEKRPRIIINASLSKKAIELVWKDDFNKLMETQYDRYVGPKAVFYILKEERN